MTSETPKREGLLAPIASRYKPSEADFARIRGKIEASLAAPADPLTSRFRFTKWVGLSCVAILLGGVAAIQYRTTETTVAPPAPSPAVAQTAPVAVPAETTDTVPSMSVDALPSVALPTSAPPASARVIASSKPALAGDTLAEETRLLAEAESAFRRGDDARALSFVDDHAKRFPHGLLEDERIAERIIVLCHAGRRSEAEGEARVLLRRRAPDPLTRRVAVSCPGIADRASETP